MKIRIIVHSSQMTGTVATFQKVRMRALKIHSKSQLSEKDLRDALRHDHSVKGKVKVEHLL